MSGPRGLWAALPCDVHYSEPMARVRRMYSPTADVYYYRAIAWCKAYEVKSGEMFGRWEGFAAWAQWPDSPEGLEHLFTASGLVVGAKQELFWWYRFNGWILAKYDRDAKRQRDRRRAGKASAKARREKARTKPETAKSLQKGRLVGRVRRASVDDPRTVRGRKV